MDISKRLFDENFLVIEIGPSTIRGALLALDKEKRIAPLQTFPEMPWGSRLPYLRLPGRKPVAVIGCDSSLAYTALIPVHFIRERIREPLRQIELENLLSQAIGKTINQCRKEAAEALKIDELDVLLAKSRVVNFRIDGHEVLNPLGLRAQKIEGLVELTLTTRPVYEEARRLTGSDEVFFTEGAYAELSALEKVEQGPVKLLQLRPWHSSFFIRDAAQVGYAVNRGELEGWTTACFEEAIVTAWGVSRESARIIYQRQLENLYSDGTNKFLSKLIKLCTQMFNKELESSGLKGKVFVDSNLPLPFEFPLKKRGMTVYAPPIDALLERFGFTMALEETGPLSAPMLFPLLAPFFESFYDRSQGALNQWLRKHLNWLGAPLDKNDRTVQYH